METFQLLFRAPARINADEAEHALQGYLGALSKNGQILGDWPTAKVRTGYQVVVQVPRRDALSDRNANRWVRRALKKLQASGLRAAGIRRLGREPESRPPCECRRRPFLVLFTNFMSKESPVRCGRCFGPVPLYALPSTYEAGDYSDLLRWQDTYKAIDWLWIGSGVGEHYGHRQMSKWKSPLSKEGRELAALLETKTRRPVYYYLMKHFGSSDAQERRRKCPSCGKPWALATPLHDIFDFRCERCRLLSNIAFDVRLETD